MKKINEKQMAIVEGGSRASATIGGVACATLAIASAFMTFGISAAIFGPTCAGMIFYTVYD